MAPASCFRHSPMPMHRSVADASDPPSSGNWNRVGSVAGA